MNGEVQYADWWVKYWHFRPFHDGRILVATQTRDPAQKTSFLYVYETPALPYDDILNPYRKSMGKVGSPPGGLNIGIFGRLTMDAFYFKL